MKVWNVLLAAMALTGAAHADIVVNAADSVYGAGLGTPVGDSLAPVSLAVNGGDRLNFAVTGRVMLNHGTGDNWNNADGFGAVVSRSSSSGAGSLSGIRAPNAGYLAGVFLGVAGNVGPAPGSLDFLSTGTNFNSLTPQLKQVFFIGDGLTGNGNGAVQDFFAPTGATALYLGIVDACGYNGGPYCYGDNRGSFNVQVNDLGAPGAVPEPGSLLLAAPGLMLLGLGRRSRQKP